MQQEKQESTFAKNIKFLRIRKKITQDFLSSELGFTRAKLTAYENGQTKSPNIDDLVKFKNYFKLSIDMLLSIDLSKFSELKLQEIENNFEYAKGTNLRIITITVDKDQKENIDYVPIKVKAGYMVGYNDPDFIKELPKVSLPFISQGKTMRMFECEGDSMYPLPEKCKVLGEYVEDWFSIKDGGIYIVISHGQGYAIKTVIKRFENNSLTLKSLNPDYPDYEVYFSDINEIWKFKGYYSDQFPTLDNLVFTKELLDKIESLGEFVKKKVAY